MTLFLFGAVVVVVAAAALLHTCSFLDMILNVLCYSFL
jgi:hypothetical protein